MSDAAIWTVILGLGALSALIRYSFLGLLQGVEVPERVRTALGFVPVTVMPAIAAPMVMLSPGADSWAEPHRILAGAAALVAGAVSRNMLAAIVVGMGAFLLLRAVGI